VNAKLAGLARRRERLIAESARQREEFGLAYRRLLDSFGWINLAVGAIETVKAHPAAVTGLTALAVGAGWTRFQRLGKWLWLGWTVLARLQARRSGRRA